MVRTHRRYGQSSTPSLFLPQMISPGQICGEEVLLEKCLLSDTDDQLTNEQEAALISSARSSTTGTTSTHGVSCGAWAPP